MKRWRSAALSPGAVLGCDPQRRYPARMSEPRPPGPAPAKDFSSDLVVTPDGTSLRVVVRDRGEKIPYLLVHGLASNARLWDGVGLRLAEAGHPSVAVDQRGHGESDKVDHGFDFATLVTDLETVIRSTVGRPVIVAGQSWGGNVVLELAADRPDLVAGVVCVDGGFIKLSESFPDWSSVERQLAPPRLSGMAAVDLEAGMRAGLTGFPPAAIEAQLANFEILTDGTVRQRLSFDRHMTILRFLWEHDPDELSTRVHQPVMVIAALGGAPGHTERVQGFAGRLSRGSVVWMDAHHDMHAQRPEDIGDLLLRFADEVVTTPPGGGAL